MNLHEESGFFLNKQSSTKLYAYQSIRTLPNSETHSILVKTELHFAQTPYPEHLIIEKYLDI